MKLTAQWFINSTQRELENYKNGYKQILDGTFKYDGSLPNEMVNALYKSKITILTKAIEYLNTLPLDKIISTNIGSGEELRKYYSIVNSL